MVFISEKRINGKKRYYLEKSIRFPDGNIKKYSVYLRKYDPSTPRGTSIERDKLKEKVHTERMKWASKYYDDWSLHGNDVLEELEEIRLDYKRVVSKLTKNQWKDVLDRFTANFTYESNALEGNSLTLKDVTMILHEKRVLKGKDLREVYETLNTRESIDLIFNNKLKISQKDIINLHKILIKETGVTIGYKQLPNVLIGRSVKTTPPEKVEEEMSKLIEMYGKEERMHPLKKAVIFHGLFEKVHPFEDGNGRVGRLIINIMLLSNGYPPLIIRKSQRIAYFAALEAFDNGHTGKLERFLVEKYKETYEKFFKMYIKYLKY